MVANIALYCHHVFHHGHSFIVLAPCFTLARYCRYRTHSPLVSAVDANIPHFWACARELCSLVNQPHSLRHDDLNMPCLRSLTWTWRSALCDYSLRIWSVCARFCNYPLYFQYLHFTVLSHTHYPCTFLNGCWIQMKFLLTITLHVMHLKHFVWLLW